MSHKHSPIYIELCAYLPKVNCVDENGFGQAVDGAFGEQLVDQAVGLLLDVAVDGLFGGAAGKVDLVGRRQVEGVQQCEKVRFDAESLLDEDPVGQADLGVGRTPDPVVVVEQPQVVEQVLPGIVRTEPQRPRDLVVSPALLRRRVKQHAERQMDAERTHHDVLDLVLRVRDGLRHQIMTELRHAVAEQKRDCLHQVPGVLAWSG